MAEFYWPQDLIPGSVQWKVIDATAVFASPLTGTVRTVSRPGTRLACSISIPTLSGRARHRFMALIAALRGRDNRIWLPDISTVQQGSFPASELLANTTFPNTTGWTSSNAELQLLLDSGRMRLARTAVAADRTASSPISTVSGAAYLFRSGMLKGYGNVNYALQLGTSAGGAELAATSAKTANGYQQLSAIASGATSYPSFKDLISGRATDNFQIVDTPSAARCILVNGASQLGSALLVDALPASTNGLLYAGDMVAVYTTTWEMKRLVADLNSNGSGGGYLMFEPPLRSAPADNSPIAVWRPMARFLLATGEVPWSTAPGLFSDFSFDFIEDLT